MGQDIERQGMPNRTQVLQCSIINQRQSHSAARLTKGHNMCTLHTRHTFYLQRDGIGISGLVAPYEFGQADLFYEVPIPVEFEFHKLRLCHLGFSGRPFLQQLPRLPCTYILDNESICASKDVCLCLHLWHTCRVSSTQLNPKPQVISGGQHGDADNDSACLTDTTTFCINHPRFKIFPCQWRLC